VGSFDELNGLPCEVGTPNAGTVSLVRNSITGVESILCVPTNGTLQSAATLQPGEIDPTLTDPALYAWMNPPGRDDLNIVAEYHRYLEPSADTRYQRFNDNLVYEIHIARGPSSLADVVTYKIRFTTHPGAHTSPGSAGSQPSQLPSVPARGAEALDALTGTTQTFTVTKVVGNNSAVIAQDVSTMYPNIGPEANLIRGGTPYETAAEADTHSLTGGGNVWAGPRADAEFAPLGELRDVVNLFGTNHAEDSFHGFNSLDVALQIPTTQLTSDGTIPSSSSTANDLAVWTSVAVVVPALDGTPTEVQIARAGQPLFDDLFIGDQDKSTYLSSTPTDDAANLVGYFDNPILVRDAAAVQAYSNSGGPSPPLAVCNIENGGPPETNRVADEAPVFNLTVFGGNQLINPISTFGDVLRVDPAMPASTGWPDGRQLTDDTAAKMTQLVLCTLTNASVNAANPIPAGYFGTDPTTPVNAMPFAPPPYTYVNSGH
jgi:hypothetical protein